ncbi:acid-sensing ion channel 5, partial [Biomphalaria glabrata]
MRNRGKIPTGSSQVVAEVNESILNMKPHKRPGILGFIWSLMIVACLVAFALQVRQQVLYLISNPKTVNKEAISLGSLEFPTVTICNENAF